MPLLALALYSTLTWIGGPETPSRVIEETFHAPALARNRLGDAARQRVLVHLPPSYASQPKRRYPVVYFLHGYGFQSGPGALVQQRSRQLDTAMGQPGAQEFIVVEPWGRTRLGGAFYVDSPVTGAWETHITQELVAFIDKRFRTWPRPESRGIAGMSMGGYGCMNLAMRHPDVYAATLSVCGGFLKAGSLQNGAMPTWDPTFQQAYGAAFAPDLCLPPPHARIPRFDGSPEDQGVIRAWESGFGDFPGKIRAYLAAPRRLKGIGLVAGTRDAYGWIPEGTGAFAQALRDAGIPHTLRWFEGGHEIPADFVERDLVPFFSRTLQGR